MSSLEEMVKAILIKSGVISYTRVLRIIQDALIVQGNPQAIDNEMVLTHLNDYSAIILAESQLFIAKSDLIFEKSRRMSAIRDSAIVKLLSTGNLNATQLMTDAQCEFQYLAPIIASVATMDK